MKKLLLLLIVISPLTLHSQVSITPYVSSGYINHLGRSGINSEFGIEAQFDKRLDLSVYYRTAKATRDVGNDVTISGLCYNISFILINRDNHRFMLGTGLTNGKYKRYTDYLGLDNHYKTIWWDPFKIRYDYTINNRIRLGAIFSVTGEDGDGSTYIGALLGYRF